MEITLKKPIKVNEKTIDKITMNLESLKGSDIITIEQEVRLLGDNSLNPLLSSNGLAHIVAKSSGLVVEDVFELFAPDFLRVTTEAKVFLLEWELVEETA